MSPRRGWLPGCRHPDRAHVRSAQLAQSIKMPRRIAEGRLCRRFAEAGMSVVVADLSGEELDRTVGALKAISPRGLDRILKAPTDVTDPEQVQRLAAGSLLLTQEPRS